MYVIDKASVSGWKMSFKLFTLTVFFASKWLTNEVALNAGYHHLTKVEVVRNPFIRTTVCCYLMETVN